MQHICFFAFLCATIYDRFVMVCVFFFSVVKKRLQVYDTYMCINTCLVYVYYVIKICVLCVHFVFNICSLYVYYVINICLLYVHYMFVIC
jgi:hypothetical protein